MTDTLTESFCERCGTRYSFEKVAKPRRGGLGRVRVLSRTLRNYVANDGMPMSEARAAAENDEDRANTARQLDAFHKAFNFCLSCRQYTCRNCWNSKTGECLTCSPDLSREVLPALFPDLPAAGPLAGGNGRLDHATIDATAWPRIDLDRPVPAGPPDHESAGGDADLAALRASEPGDAGRGALHGELAAIPGTPQLDELTEAELAEIQDALAAHVGPSTDVLAEAVATEPAAVPEPETARAAEAEPLAAEIVTEPAETAPEPTTAVAAEAEVVAEPAGAAPKPTTAVAAEAEAVAEPAETEVPVVAKAETVAEPAEGSFEAEAAAAPEPAEPVAAEAEVVGEPAEAAPEPVPAAPTAPADRAGAARGQTRGLLGRFRPRRPQAVESEPTPVSVAASTVEAAPRLETVSLPAAPETPPAAPAVPETPLPAAATAAPETPPIEAPAPVDVVVQPTWTIMAPDSGTTPESPPPPATAPGPATGWPTAPAWPASPAQPPTVIPQAASPWAARLAAARPDPIGVWAASSQEVLGAPVRPGATAAPPAVQPCVSCGLSLSANARFCRRCGARQG